MSVRVINTDGSFADYPEAVGISCEDAHVLQVHRDGGEVIALHARDKWLSAQQVSPEAEARDAV